MTQRSRAYLTSKFITLYKPTQQDYTDLFDSFYALLDDLTYKIQSASGDSEATFGNTGLNEFLNITADGVDVMDYRSTYGFIKVALRIINSNTIISRDGGGNMTFVDGVTSVKTLAELASPIPKASQGEVDAGTDDTNYITSLKLRSTTFIAGQIPSLDASKTTTGQFSTSRIPDLHTNKTTSGVFDPARIPQATESALGGGEIATQVETDAVTSDTTFVTPLKLNKLTPESSWNTATLDAAWSTVLSQTLRYKKINDTTIQIIGWVTKDTTLTELITTLPVGYRPSSDTWFPVSSSYDAGSGVNFNSGCGLKTDGKLEFGAAANFAFSVTINAMVPLDL